MAPEWKAAQHAVNNSLQAELPKWTAFANCTHIEIYTDGSAPVRNPGGPCGFAAVVVGFEKAGAREPAARLDLGGYVEGRKAEPKTSNNRAEIAGLLLAYEALNRLKQLGCPTSKATVWTDSQYAMYCANGTWQRKKNTDLWPILDSLSKGQTGAKIQWVRGHAGNAYNELADVLATKGAFNFDDEQYMSYRRAQQASGREMPDSATLSKHGVGDNKAEAAPASKGTEIDQWTPGADYTLVLYTRALPNAHPTMGPHKGEYRIWNKEGRAFSDYVNYAQKQGSDEAEYTTLVRALTGLLNKVIAGGGDPAKQSLTVYSRQELMVKQIKGEYRVKAAALQPLYAQTNRIIARFKKVDLVYRDTNAIKRAMHEEMGRTA